MGTKASHQLRGHQLHPVRPKKRGPIDPPSGNTPSVKHDSGLGGMWGDYIDPKEQVRIAKGQQAARRLRG